ncbi:MAG: sigma-70 family RNA polymerase sigma factor [Planctomycetota bacterium]
MPEPHELYEFETMVLIDRHLGGDPEALQVLFQRHYPTVERIVRVRLGAFLAGREEVGDMVQGTMLHALRHLQSFEPREDARFVNWLAKIAANVIRDRQRYWGAQVRNPDHEVALAQPGQPGLEDSRGWDLVADTAAVPEKLDNREREEIVDACLASLPDADREIILLRDFAGASWSYIAEELGEPTVATAQGSHKRAREALKVCVRRRLTDSA